MPELCKARPAVESADSEPALPVRVLVGQPRAPVAPERALLA